MSLCHRSNIDIKRTIEVIMLKMHSLKHIQSIVVVENIDFFANEVLFWLILGNRNASFRSNIRVCFSDQLKLNKCLELSGFIIFQSKDAVGI